MYDHFLKFIPVNNCKILTEVIINDLNKHKLELNDCRGQGEGEGYDKGANMENYSV